MEMTAFLYIPALILAVAFMWTGKAHLVHMATALMVIEAVMVAPNGIACITWSLLLAVLLARHHYAPRKAAA